METFPFTQDSHSNPKRAAEICATKITRCKSRQLKTAMGCLGTWLGSGTCARPWPHLLLPAHLSLTMPTTLPPSPKKASFPISFLPPSYPLHTSPRPATSAELGWHNLTSTGLDPAQECPLNSLVPPLVPPLPSVVQTCLACNCPMGCAGPMGI